MFKAFCKWFGEVLSRDFVPFWFSHIIKLSAYVNLWKNVWSKNTAGGDSWREQISRPALGCCCCGNCLVSSACIGAAFSLEAPLTTLSVALVTFLDSSPSFSWISMAENTIREKSSLKTGCWIQELPEISLWKLGRFPQPMSHQEGYRSDMSEVLTQG